MENELPKWAMDAAEEMWNETTFRYLNDPDSADYDRQVECERQEAAAIIARHAAASGNDTSVLKAEIEQLVQWKGEAIVEITHLRDRYREYFKESIALRRDLAGIQAERATLRAELERLESAAAASGGAEALRQAVKRALDRYDREDKGGLETRAGLAWAMANDLRDALTPSPVQTEDTAHEHRWVGKGEAGSSLAGFMCADCGVDADDLDDASPAPERTCAEWFDLVEHLSRQREWSERTFGPGNRTHGVLDHIRKELIEVEQSPRDLSEWIDVVILAFDGAWRAGHLPHEIVAALRAKQAKNEARKWPDWRTMPADKAIEHDRSGGEAQ